jgi:hypothetical protein
MMVMAENKSNMGPCQTDCEAGPAAAHSCAQIRCSLALNFTEKNLTHPKDMALSTLNFIRDV